MSDDVKSYVRKLKESGVLDEMSTTSGADGYDTPFAFDGEDEQEHEKNMSVNVERNGYQYPVAKKKRNTVSNESVFKQVATSLHEISYKEFSSDESATPKHKINSKIKEINRMVYEVERLVKHANRFKTETNLDQSHYWKQSRTKLSKIAERMIRISKNITDLGA